MAIPELWIIAGPNGSGKSTLYDRILGARLSGFAYVNPDAIARTLSGTPATVLMAAGRETVSQARDHIASGRNVAVESTLSGHTYFRIAESAKAIGYRVTIAVVFVQNTALSQRRIAERVATGGHDVPDADIRRRFPRSLSNCRRMMGIADHWMVFENSGGEPRLLASRDKTGVTIYDAVGFQIFERLAGDDDEAD